MACRVKLRGLPSNPSRQDRENAFRRMFAIFKKQVVEAEILHEYKEHEFYESPGEKRRRKKKEAVKNAMKQKLKENFPEKRNYKNEE
jgi:ribosomal protein S21